MSPLLNNLPPEGSEVVNSRVTHRRVEITVEREVISVVGGPAASFSSWCQQCGRDVQMLSAEAAAAAQRVSPREIYRWLDENRLHFQELPGGTVFICSESLQSSPTRRLP